jgi:flagellar basal-body rod protein FlgB
MAAQTDACVMTGAVARAHEETIAKAMIGVATELRLADAGELMTMIRADQAANIADLVNSSTELFFKNGTLRYALSAGCCVRWDATPVVRLDMEFRHAEVCAFFRLVIGRKRAAVELVDLMFDEPGLDKFRAKGPACRGNRRCAAAAAVRRAPVRVSLEQGPARSMGQEQRRSRSLADAYIQQIAAQNAHWLTQRQSLIADNVANASTPGYRARDLPPFASMLNGASIGMATTNAAHLTPLAQGPGEARVVEAAPSDESVSGNSVNLEQQMINLGDVNRAYAMNTGIKRVFQQMLLATLK